MDLTHTLTFVKPLHIIFNLAKSLTHSAEEASEQSTAVVTVYIPRYVTVSIKGGFLRSSSMVGFTVGLKSAAVTPGWSRALDLAA